MNRLWLRSLGQRPRAAVLLWLLSTVAVLTAVLAPLLIRAVAQSTLTDTLRSGGLAATQVAVTGEVEEGVPYDQARNPVLEALEAGRSGSATSAWTEPQVFIAWGTNLVWAPKVGDVRQASAVSVLDDGCGPIVVTTGACPSKVGQTMISSADAEESALKVGSVIHFSLARSTLTSLKVVGLYDADRSGAARLVRPGTTAGVLAGIERDPVVITAQQSADLPVKVDITARMTLVDDLQVAQVQPVRDSIDRVKTAVNAQDRLLSLDSTVTDELDTVDQQSASAQVLILVVAVQALGLTVFALAIVLGRVGAARAAEWSVGRLRGVPRPRWLVSVYAEPLVALLLGLPAGFAAGLGVARLATDLTLRAGTPLEPTRPVVLLAAVAAVLIAVVALVLVSLRSVRRPLAELVAQEAEGRELSRLGAVAHVAVALLAAATLYQLLAGGLLSASGPQLGLLAPGLFALAVAMLAVRAAVLLVRRVTRRAPRGLAGLVVGRHAARTPSTLNPAMVIAVGVALAIFATQVLALSVRNQGLRADAATGAGTVLGVSVPDAVNLTEAVDAADPSGRQAMAVQETAVGSGSGSARIVAVDSSRLAAVSSWSTAWANVADLAATLRGTDQPAITLTGSSVTVDLRNVRVRARTLPDPNAVGAIDPPPPPELVVVVEQGGHWTTVSLGRLDRISNRQQLTAELPCTDGCRLVTLGLRAATNQPYGSTFTVASVATDRTDASESTAWLTSAGRWRSQSALATVGEPSQTATAKATARGLAVTAEDLEGGVVTGVSPTDTADPLPAVLGPSTFLEAVPGEPGVVTGTGLDGQSTKLRVIGRASVLPRALDDGVLVDLTNADGLIDPSTRQTIDEVWLASDLTDAQVTAIEKKLAAAKVRVQTRSTLAEARTVLLSQAVTRGATASVTFGLVALVLGLLALVAARAADAGRRSGDWRSLREAGLGLPALRRLVRLEIAVPAALGVLGGVASGAVAARIAVTRLPLVDVASPGPPLDLRLEWLPVGLIALVALLVIVVVAEVGARAETRREGGGR